MMTDWKWRIFLFVREADNTPENRQALASIYVNNGGMETLVNELKMFDNVVRFSVSGGLPAQAFGVNTPAKTAMRDDFKTLMDSLTNARYMVVANTELPNYADGEYILTNFSIDPVGQIVTWTDTLTHINDEFGLNVIPPAVDV